MYRSCVIFVLTVQYSDCPMGVVCHMYWVSCDTLADGLWQAVNFGKRRAEKRVRYLTVLVNVVGDK